MLEDWREIERWIRSLAGLLRGTRGFSFLTKSTPQAIRSSLCITTYSIKRRREGLVSASLQVLRTHAAHVPSSVAMLPTSNPLRGFSSLLRQYEKSVPGLVTLLRKVAEREGFEPPVPFRYNGFQDRRIRPLCHLS